MLEGGGALQGMKAFCLGQRKHKSCGDPIQQSTLVQNFTGNRTAVPLAICKTGWGRGMGEEGESGPGRKGDRQAGRQAGGQAGRQHALSLRFHGAKGLSIIEFQGCKGPKLPNVTSLEVLTLR